MGKMQNSIYMLVWELNKVIDTELVLKEIRAHHPQIYIFGMRIILSWGKWEIANAGKALHLPLSA